MQRDLAIALGIHKATLTPVLKPRGAKRKLDIIEACKIADFLDMRLWHVVQLELGEGVHVSKNKRDHGNILCDIEEAQRLLKTGSFSQGKIKEDLVNSLNKIKSSALTLVQHLKLDIRDV